MKICWYEGEILLYGVVALYDVFDQGVFDQLVWLCHILKCCCQDFVNRLTSWPETFASFSNKRDRLSNWFPQYFGSPETCIRYQRIKIWEDVSAGRCWIPTTISSVKPTLFPLLQPTRVCIYCSNHAQIKAN